MPIDLLPLVSLATVCAPSTDQQILLSVAKVESGFEPLAIGVNGKAPRHLLPTSSEQAVSAANRLIAEGENIDLGLGQINSNNLSRLGLSVSAAFDPCTNLAASAKIIGEGYALAKQRTGQSPQAWPIALSLYNTGHSQRGVDNGYVAKVLNAATQLAPAIARLQALSPEAIAAPQPPPAAPSWDVFAKVRGLPASFVFSPARSRGVSP